MHIMEGFLPVEHALGWSIAAAPFVALGLRSVRRQLNEHPEQRMLLGVAAAFSFVLSALKLPSVTGSCSHPTGVGLGALLFGPLAMVPVGLVVLLFQALLLAHGGLTTLGANLFSLAIVGSFVAAGLFRAGRLPRTCRSPSASSPPPAGRPGDLPDDLDPARLGLPRSGRRLCRIVRQVRRHLRHHADPAGDQRRPAHRAGGQCAARFNPTNCATCRCSPSAEVQA
jgi:hypothetical protein